MWFQMIIETTRDEVQTLFARCKSKKCGYIVDQKGLDN